MKLSSVRTLAELRSVLKEPLASGPDPVYWVFSEISTRTKLANLTVIAPGRFNGEYPKTFGHYHHNPATEIYHQVYGEGILLLQKKHLENGVWRPEKVEEVLLVTIKPGDEVTIKPEYGHSWSNVGDGPLLLYDNWSVGHWPADYEMIQKLHGLAYFLLEENGEPTAIPNPLYQNLPEPVWLTAQEFMARQA